MQHDSTPPAAAKPQAQPREHVLQQDGTLAAAAQPQEQVVQQDGTLHQERMLSPQLQVLYRELDRVVDRIKEQSATEITGLADRYRRLAGNYERQRAALKDLRSDFERRG